ncbi:Uncharacterised protein [Zhongshania aliphaticivorans]|uniref:DUF1302 domain-containing protein n=1 Tax=Zhongshania aliphaticivorans TaxID=1470434 RepID=A0A5S9QBK2_9GAMM|nr:DUF1302 family protein [Zhongshania aliphaticivorans]CAA0114701.1 Uncharacterised protein [Zhongshania aliphaticivorans]CAA0122993.1 Uncharacterised protein [Zhongshania aliphaticivorans]
MKNNNQLAAAITLATLGVSNPAWSANGELFGIDYSSSGFIRVEAAAKTVGDENPFNQRGNIFNGETIDRDGGVNAGTLLGLNLPIAVGVPITDQATRNGEPANNDFNFTQVRLENTLQLRFSDNWSATVKLRGIFDAAQYDEFDPNSVNSDAAGYLYGEPNYFEYDDYETGGEQNRLEVAGDNYMIDFPSLYVDYQNGPILVRAGNQQIAWGQALFFRVMDVANGLDLRRHLILDFASEEYADERISSPAVRVSYQLTPSWELDMFAQAFQPTIYANPNTPYNVIPSQFTVHDRYSDANEKINSGFRLKGNVGDFGLQFMYTNRYNPDGVIRWTASGVNRDAPGLPGTGAILAQTPLEVDSTGVWSAEEWFTYASMARLDGTEGLNKLITDFPASQLLLARPVNGIDAAKEELDLFFILTGGVVNSLTTGQGMGGLRGHIEREYKREDIFGTGFSYIFSGEAGSWLDQLILNFEVSFTPDRVFTSPDLGQEYLVEDEYISALVLEKYQRFSRKFPATYFVFQWMHRTESDLFGRHLSGMGGSANNTPEGVDAWDGLVLAIQQPFPGLVWRADLSVLYDTRGGIYVQPALKWKPSGNWNIEAFYSYIDDDLSANANENIMQTFDWAEEFGLRVAYQF